MKQKMIICISILIVLVLTVIIVLNHPAFSRTPRGERLVRIERSPNYKEGQFVNQEPTPFMTTDKSRWRIMWDNLTEKKPDNLIPSESIHAVKTDLKRLNLSKDAVVWFGHSSYLLINGGKKILVDPVLTTGFPVSLMMKPFKGTDIYSPEDIPEVDYLIITHDHYDHLDYGTVKAIRDKVDKVICPLGVGEHLEYWGYSAEKIVETAKRTGAKVSGPIPLPTDKEIITILRATHKYKDSREQFERRTHKRLIDVVRPTQKTTEALQKLEIPAGVDIVMELK